MPMQILKLAVLAALYLAPAPVAGQKTAKPSLPPGDLFFTLKGRPFALETLVPGIQGALLLTEEQKLKLAEALAGTIRSDAVRSASKLLKEGPDASEAQKEEANKLIRSARARLQDLVADSLTQEQKSLIARIETASHEAHAMARKNLEIEFTLTKKDKSRLDDLNRQLREQVRAEIERSLSEILTSEQQQGMELAARQQREAEEASRKKAKPCNL